MYWWSPESLSLIGWSPWDKFISPTPFCFHFVSPFSWWLMNLSLCFIFTPFSLYFHSIFTPFIVLKWSQKQMKNVTPFSFCFSLSFHQILWDETETKRSGTNELWCVPTLNANERPISRLRRFAAVPFVKTTVKQGQDLTDLRRQVLKEKVWQNGFI